jgi:hypothetical protein
MSFSRRELLLRGAALAASVSVWSHAHAAIEEENSDSPNRFINQLIPGQLSFVFTMYGLTGALEISLELVRVMHEQQIGSGFDAGPTPNSSTKPIFDYLAKVGWPIVCWPGSADFQVKGGRCVLGPENAAALSSMDSAGIFAVMHFGEWGYYFHVLSSDEGWWRGVYGDEFDNYKHLMKPEGLAGYDRRPQSKQECFDIVQDYFKSRCSDELGRVISVTGHSHYEAYAGEWGAKCIGLELGENIAFTQSKLAFARGASRQWKTPWSVQVSPWLSGACTSSGPLRFVDGNARGLDAGHSLSFNERMWLHAWFAGAAMVTPENSISEFFDAPTTPWTLTEYGSAASDIVRFTRSHDRGTPWTPIAIVIDHLAGYNAYTDKPWGILEPTEGDRQVRDLFDYQLFPGSDHIHHAPNKDNPEATFLVPTPFGEIFDVQLTSASAEMLASYPVLLLAGDISFDDELLSKLEHCLNQGRALLISPEHLAGLGSKLASNPRVEALSQWTNPATGRSAAISNTRLTQLVSKYLPIEVSGNPIQYQVNRTERGWVVELINNHGVVKRPDQPAVIDPDAIARVALKTKLRYSSASEWRSNTQYFGGNQLQITLGPGKTAFVEFISDEKFV